MPGSDMINSTRSHRCYSRVTTKGHRVRKRAKGVPGEVCFSGGSSGLEEKERQNVRVSFKLPYRCKYGQHLSIAGSISPLGGWNVGRCLDMHWTNGDLWQAEVEIPALRNLGSCEYKYVVRNTDGSVDTWTPGGNFALQLPPHPEDSRGVGVPEKVEVSDAWDSSSRKIKVQLREVTAIDEPEKYGKVQLREVTASIEPEKSDEVQLQEVTAIDKPEEPGKVQPRELAAVDEPEKPGEVQLREVLATGEPEKSGKLAVRIAVEEEEEALEELRSVVGNSKALMEHVDAHSPEALEADKAVLQALQRAQATSIALRQAKMMEKLGEGS